MEIIFQEGKESKRYIGYIEKINNKFIAKIEAPSNLSLPSVISNMKGFYEETGIITMMNNQNTSISEHRDNPGVSTYIYESDYVIYGDIDENKLLIKSMRIYFKENDYFFVCQKHHVNYDFDSGQFQLSQNLVHCILLENNDIIIEYVRSGSLKKNTYDQKIFENRAEINVKFKKHIKLNSVFEQLRKIECVLGFVFNRKMNLIDFSILSNDDISYTIIPPFKKEFTDVIINRTSIVDLTSLQLLKDVLKKYYSEKHLASAMNMYYEYIYNDLDNIFEFTSLVNTMELIVASKNYKDKVLDYTLSNNSELLINNKKMEKILELLSEQQQQFIKGFYNFNKIELRDKIKFIFEDIFKLPNGDNNEKYISAIINTRNFYVHGTRYSNKLNPVYLVLTKNILKNMLYLLIIYACSKEKNSLISVYQQTIPVAFKSIIENYNK